MFKLKIITLFLLLITFFSCKEKQKIRDHNDLFKQNFNRIKNDYIKTSELNWSEIENKVKDSIPKFKNNNDVHLGLEYVIEQLNDDHSFFVRGNNPNNFWTNDSIEVPKIHHEILEKGIGYLKIPGFGGNDSLNSNYASNIRKVLLEIDKTKDLFGWIIDLRGNSGGRLGMFQLGLAPLYKDSIIGYSVNNKSKYLQHKLSNNTYYYGEKKAFFFQNKVKFEDTLINKNKPIAILINKKTASMGEFTAQSFKSQKNTMLFGTKTSGLTTDLQTYRFSPSGAVLGFSTAFTCDENKNAIHGVIVPDVKCESEQSLSLAVNWIKALYNNVSI